MVSLNVPLPVVPVNFGILPIWAWITLLSGLCLIILVIITGSARHYERNRKHKNIWEKEFTWVRRAANGRKSYCTICKIEITPHRQSILRHSTGRHHKNLVENQCRPGILRHVEVVPTAPLGPRRSVKKSELKLALVAAMHFPMIAMDHLSENLKELGKRSHLENINLRRTKCTCLIQRVYTLSML